MTKERTVKRFLNPFILIGEIGIKTKQQITTMKTITEVQKETEKELSRRIKIAAKSDLQILEDKITRHYNIGTLSSNGLKRLDVKIMEKLAINN